MKLTFRIAKLELSNLFYSPVAWVVLVIFMVQSGWEFTSMVERFERVQQLGMNRSGLTHTFFAGFSGVFTKMQENLYLYIPLLTMGLISRETGSGSIKLVYSSPVKLSAVVWGKYLAMVFYCVLLMCCFVILGIVASYIVKDADGLFITSGIIGLFLLICAYSAIGLFMSSLTTYQVVAAISTLALLGGLNYIGKLWQDMDFIRDLTYFLSISGRAENFVEGLITSRDVFYFIIVILLFVGLTILKLRAGKESKPLLVKVARYTALVVCALLAGYVTSRPGVVAYKDMTANNGRTLTKGSQDVLKQMKSPLTITAYVNLLDANYFSLAPIFRNSDLERFDKYFRFRPDIRMKYIYYYDSTSNPDLYSRNKGLNTAQLAKRVASSYKLDINDLLTPAQIHKKIDLSGEGNRTLRLLEYNGKTTFLRIYEDLMRQPDEKEITAAIKRLVTEPAKVAFVTGHNERSIKRMADNDYKLSTIEKTFRYALLNQGFSVQEIYLGKDSIPSDIAVLVIADPGMPYSPEQLQQVTTFINGGGNLLIAGEPSRREYLNPLLSTLGLSIEPGIILQKTEDLSPRFVQCALSAPGLKLLGNSPAFQQDDIVISFSGAGSIAGNANNDYHITPLIVSNTANTFKRTAPIDDSLRTAIFTPELNDERGAFPMTVALTREHNGRQQRIIVSADADFMSNAELLRNNIRTANFLFTTELFRWFTYGLFPVDTSRPPLTDSDLRIGATGVNYLKMGLVGFLPALIVAGVVIMMIRRKRR